MPHPTNREFLRRQDEERQRNLRLNAEAQEARVNARTAGSTTITRRRTTTSILDELLLASNEYFVYTNNDAVRQQTSHDGVVDSAFLGLRHTYINDRRGFTVQDLNNIIDGVNRQPGLSVNNGPTTYDMTSTVARYGHLLTAADQQRLGYVAPATPLEAFPSAKTEAAMQALADQRDQREAQERAAAAAWLKTSPWG